MVDYSNILCLGEYLPLLRRSLAGRVRLSESVHVNLCEKSETSVSKS